MLPRLVWNKQRPSTQGQGHPTEPPACSHPPLTCQSEDRIGEVKVMRMFTVIQKDEYEKRKVINKSRKSCKIMRSVAKEYPARLIHIAERYSYYATMHLLPPPLRVCLSRTGGFTKVTVKLILRWELYNVTYRLREWPRQTRS